MTDEQERPDKKREKLFDVAADVRKFEIGLFWHRSLFFWGFIASAFVGYAALAKDEDKTLAILVACFGLICSFAWTLVNRGNKYWQEAWEQKVEDAEMAAFGTNVFKAPMRVMDEKGWWLQAREYSVSKIAIALSDFTVGVWIAVLIISLPWSALRSNCVPPIFLLPIGTVIYAFLLASACRSTDRRKEHPLKQNSPPPP